MFHVQNIYIYNYLGTSVAMKIIHKYKMKKTVIGLNLSIYHSEILLC